MSNNRYDIFPIKRVTRKFLEVSFRRPRGSHSGREKFSSTGMRAPGYRLSPDHFQKFMRIPAPDWAQKKLCIIVPSWQTISPGIFSFREFVHDGYCRAALARFVHQRNAHSQKTFSLI